MNPWAVLLFIGLGLVALGLAFGGRIHISIHCLFIGIGPLSLTFHAPWSWLYGFRSYLWGWAPDDYCWFMRILGLEIAWMHE